MLKQEQNKRFTTMPGGRQEMNEKLSLLRCYWYVPTDRSIAPIANANDDSQHQRPEYIHELVQ